MKRILAFTIILVLIQPLIFAQQTERKPYIIPKSGGKKEYQKVKQTYFGGAKGISSTGDKKRYKRADLSSILTGKDGKMNQQLVYLKIKGFGFGDLDIVDGKGSAYTVFIKQGDCMIATKRQQSTTFQNNNISASPYHTSTNSNNYYYYIKGNKAKVLIGVEWLTNSFIDDLINDFSNCEEISAILEEYRGKKLKLVQIPKLFLTLKKAYYTSCYSE